jgi:hypothetical protein
MAQRDDNGMTGGLVCQADQWTTLALRVRQLAWVSGVSFDDESLLYLDRRDLQALERRLREDLDWRQGGGRRPARCTAYGRMQRRRPDTSPAAVLAVALATLTPLVAPAVLLMLLIAVLR